MTLTLTIRWYQIKNNNFDISNLHYVSLNYKTFSFIKSIGNITFNFYQYRTNYIQFLIIVDITHECLKQLPLIRHQFAKTRRFSRTKNALQDQEVDKKNINKTLQLNIKVSVIKLMHETYTRVSRQFFSIAGNLPGNVVF